MFGIGQKEAKVVIETVDYCSGDLEVALKENDKLKFEIERLKDENNNLKSEKEGYKSRLKDSGNKNKKLSLKLGKLKKEKQQAIKEFAEKIIENVYWKIQANEPLQFEETVNDLLKEYDIGEE